jgi:hypothetical protein
MQDLACSACWRAGQIAARQLCLHRPVLASGSAVFSRRSSASSVAPSLMGLGMIGRLPAGDKGLVPVLPLRNSFDPTEGEMLSDVVRAPGGSACGQLWADRNAASAGDSIAEVA